MSTHLLNRAGQHSQYSDWLWAGRSGDRIPVGARFSTPVQTSPGAHPASCTMGTGSFLGVKSGQGVTLTPHPLLVPLVIKEQSYTSTPPVGRTACTEPQCLYKGDLYLFFYLLNNTSVNKCQETPGLIIKRKQKQLYICPFWVGVLLQCLGRRSKKNTY